MRVSVVCEGLWLEKNSQCIMIGNRFELPHDTIPSTVIGHFTETDNNTGQHTQTDKI